MPRTTSAQNADKNGYGRRWQIGIKCVIRPALQERCDCLDWTRCRIQHHASRAIWLIRLGGALEQLKFESQGKPT